jgi:hypothetical protein
MFQKNLIFSTKFYPFYTRDATNRFSMKRYCMCIEGKYISANFLFDFFDWNMSTMYFQIKEACAPMSQNAAPRFVTFLFS